MVSNILKWYTIKINTIPRKNHFKLKFQIEKK